MIGSLAKIILEYFCIKLKRRIFNGFWNNICCKSRIKGIYGTQNSSEHVSIHAIEKC